MPDKFSKETRSKVMSNIRSKDTYAERIVRNGLKGLHLRYHPKVIGKPDFGSKKRKIAVFIDGCFWHKCPRCYIQPKSNREYWLPKIARNVQRDKSINKILRRDGWKVIRIWEHNFKKNQNGAIKKLREAIEKIGQK